MIMCNTEEASIRNKQIIQVRMEYKSVLDKDLSSNLIRLLGYRGSLLGALISRECIMGSIRLIVLFLNGWTRLSIGKGPLHSLITGYSLMLQIKTSCLSSKDHILRSRLALLINLMFHMIKSVMSPSLTCTPRIID